METKRAKVTTRYYLWATVNVSIAPLSPSKGRKTLHLSKCRARDRHKFRQRDSSSRYKFWSIERWIYSSILFRLISNRWTQEEKEEYFFFFFLQYKCKFSNETNTLRDIQIHFGDNSLHSDKFWREGSARKLFDSELSDNQEAENKKWPFPAERERNEIDSFIKATGLYFNRTRGANCAWILNGALHFVEAATEPRVSAAIAQTNFLRDAIVSLFLLN